MSKKRTLQRNIEKENEKKKRKENNMEKRLEQGSKFEPTTDQSEIDKLSTAPRGIDAFPYYCPGARRGNVFVATWLLRPRPRSTSIVLYASPTVTMWSLRGFLHLVFDL